MPIGALAGALIGAGVSAGTSIYGAHKQASAAKDAANTQAQAALRASDLLRGASDQSLRDIGAERERSMGTLTPYTQLGTMAASQLANPDAMRFTAPTMADVEHDPGYQFRLQQGQKALERSAAARGTLLTGGTLKSLTDFGQGLASQEYQNVYNRRLGESQDTFGRLSSLLNFGYGAQTQENQTGLNYADLLSRTRLAGAGYAGQGLTDAANAQAAGRVAGANAYSGVLSGIGNNIQDLATLYGVGAFRRKN